MVDGARKWVRDNKCFSSPAPKRVVDDPLSDGLLMQIDCFGGCGIVGHGLEPQIIVIAVVQGVSVFGTEPDVVVRRVTVTRMVCAVIWQVAVIVVCRLLGAIIT